MQKLTLPKYFDFRWFSLITLISLVIGASIGLFFGRSKFEDGAIKQIQETLEQNSIAISRLVEEYQLLPQALKVPGVIELLQASEQESFTPFDDPSLNDYLTELAIDLNLDTAFIANTNGIIVASSRRDGQSVFVGRDVSMRPYYKEAMQNGSSNYVAVARISERLGYYVARVLMDTNQEPAKPIGVAVVKLGLNNVQKILATSTNVSMVAITDANEIILASNPTGWQLSRFSAFADGDIPEKMKSTKYRGKQRGAIPITINRVLGGQYYLVDYLLDEQRSPQDLLLGRAPISGTHWMLNVFMFPKEGKAVIWFYLIAGILLALLISSLMCFFYMRRIYVEDVYEAAIRDKLTGLYTRLMMDETIPGLLERHNRDETAGVALVLFDLDKFKNINDTYGHAAGDEVLKQAAGVILKQSRSTDYCIRYGGEELAVFLCCSSSDVAIQFAERVREGIAALEIEFEGQAIKVTASAGISFHTIRESIENLFSKADKNLYKAKAQGRNCIVFEQQNEQNDNPNVQSNNSE